MTRVNLPPYSVLCWADMTQVDCDYPVTIPRKLIVADVVRNSPDLGSLIKNFAITESEFDSMAARVAYDNLTIPAAACEWLRASESVWRPWIVSHSNNMVGTSSSSTETAVSMVPIVVGIIVPVVVLVVVGVGLGVYIKKGRKRRELKHAPGGTVALVFTDIQVAHNYVDIYYYLLCYYS